MDNLTHTLVGAALGRAGLQRRTPLAMAALVIGANLPDVDVLGIPFGLNLGFRRGITHGVLALAVWPFLLTGLLLAWDRWRHRSDPARTAPDSGALLLVASVGVLSHPLLDWFNTYGMRWLMPFSDRWFYGDTWFILDPWVLGVLLGALRLGAARAGRPADPRPARWALGLVGAYALAMWASGRLAEAQVAGELSDLGFPAPREIMAAPVPVNPLARDVVIDVGGSYLRTRWGVGRPLVIRQTETLDPGLGEVDLAAVREDPQGAQFLRWTRFPFVRVDSTADQLTVILDDARYARPGGRSFARTVVRLPRRP